MSTTVNRGGQRQVFQYKQPATSEGFNRLLRHITKPGIYKGGILTNTANVIHVAPLQAIVNSISGSDDNLAVHLETTLQADITVVNLSLGLSEYLYIIFDWNNVSQNYADFQTRLTTDPPVANELILGTLNYDGAGLVTSVSEIGKTIGLYDTSGNAYFDADIKFKGTGNWHDTLTSPSTAARTYTFQDKSYTLGNQADIDQFEELILSNTNYLNSRVDRADQKVLDLQIQNAYLFNRKSNSTDYMLDTYVDDVQTNLAAETVATKSAEIMDDGVWNNNWKEITGGTPDFKNAFVRPQKQPYMLEILDQYNLEGVGQTRKAGLSQWDSVNECYWFISSAGANTIGEINKLSKNMKDGKVEVLSRYYIPSGGATATWTGVESDGTQLYFVQYNSTINTSKVYSIVINSDGTIGESTYEVANGETIDLTNSIKDVHTATGGYYTDVISYDVNDIMVLQSNAGATSDHRLVSLDKATLGGGTVSDLTGLEHYIGGSFQTTFGITKYGDDIYILQNDPTDNERFIHKFDLDSDVASDVFIKSSGRWGSSRDIDSNNAGTGISVSNTGDLLEVVSTASNGNFISKRSLKNALWAENQVAGEVAVRSYDSSDLPSTNSTACMVESDRYYWTADFGVTSNQVDVFRYDTQTGTTLYGRLTGANWVSCFDLATDGTTLWMVGRQNTTNYDQVYFGTLADFVGAMGVFTTAIDITTLTDWSLAAPFATNTDNIFGIAHDGDNNILYLINETDNKIDTLSVDGTTWTQGIINLPSAVLTWIGTAYKDNKLYIADYTGSTVPGFIYVLNIDKSDNTAWYREHINQDPSRAFANNGGFNIDWHGNDLVQFHRNTFRFHKMKVLEDPDVMQLHTFLDSSNVLLSDNVSCSTPVVERYFEPSDFSDVRNVPDLNYMAVGYGDNGFSLLHLDEYWSERSSTGKIRYTPSKIRVQHYEEGTNNVVNNASYITGSIFIIDDMIYIGNYGSNSNFFIDLKSGKSIEIDSTQAGLYYDGSLSERNDAKIYIGTSNSELFVSSATNFKSYAYTFTKDDSSDFNEENPKTFVLIGTNGGCDLLVIDWDANGNRTPTKVWNNIVNRTVAGVDSIWIAPSGKIIVGDNTSAGSIAQSNVYVWGIVADANAGEPVWTNYFSLVGSSIVDSNPMDIAPNSRCWKTASGEWRHQIIVGTYDTSAAAGSDYGVAIVDIELATVEWIWEQDTTTVDHDDGFQNIDMFEDRVFSILSLDISGTQKTQNVFAWKKQYFDAISDTRNYNNWTYTLSQDNDIGGINRPNFTAWLANVTGNSKVCRYSKDQSMLIVGSSLTGAQFLHNSYLDECVIESKIILLTANPGKYNYLQTTILPD